MKIDEKLRLSVVIPVYSGADYLRDLVADIKFLRDKWVIENAPVTLDEIIFVDDDAIDDSAGILKDLDATYSWIHVIHLSRNFGQHPATIAGILHSSGEWVVTLDEDLQHKPQDIQRLFASVAHNGHDIVYARSINSVHAGSWYRDISSRLFKAIMRSLTGNIYIEMFNSFRLMRGSVARAAASLCSHETYFDMALSWFTQRIGAVPIDLKDERRRSGYSFHKLLSHARRMVVSSQTKVLRGGALIGLIALAVAIVYGAVILAQKLIFPEYMDVRGWTSLFLSILLFGGVISFLVSAILEYLSVILLHIQGKPAFFVVDRRTDAWLADYFSKADS